MKKFENIDEYIHSFPKDVQDIMIKIREIINVKDLNIKESISYGMPAFKLNGKILVYFAGYKKHIGFYATPSSHEMFKNKLSIYKQGKGSVQFPLDKQIPYDLIKEIVEFKIAEINNV